MMVDLSLQVVALAEVDLFSNRHEPPTWASRD
jgi:hypothetical protein